MPITNLTHTLIATNRSAIRREIVQLFLNESPGTGKKANSSIYNYTVESYSGLNIILMRPGRINNGFDFIVKCDAFYFKSKPNKNGTSRKIASPSHDNIIKILTQVRNSNTTHYDTNIKPLVVDMYNCRPLTVNRLPLASFIDDYGVTRPVEIILYILKWLFIEQDITYWNYSGRDMLYGILQNSSLA